MGVQTGQTGPAVTAPSGAAPAAAKSGKPMDANLPPMPILESYCSKDDLIKQTISMLRNDSSISGIRKYQKRRLQVILRNILNEVQEAVSKGENILEKLHFPLLYDRYKFEDLDQLAKRDFNIDLRRDQADEVLETFEDDIVRTIFEKVNPENYERIMALENHNDALVDRMHTIEGHLLDRSRSLSQCRYSYFLEITHLRNQVYLQGLQGNEFNPSECLYFDPCDYLEEELRQVLNEKIRDSVRIYFAKWKKSEKKVAELEQNIKDLEAQMKGNVRSTGPVVAKPLKEALAEIINNFDAYGGEDKVVECMGEGWNDAMMKWARDKLSGETSASADLQGKLDEMAAEIARLQDELGSAQMQIDQLNDELSMERATITDLNTQLGQKDMTIDELNAKIAELEARMQELEAVDEDPEMSAQLISRRLSSGKGNLQGEIDELKEELEKLRAQLADLESEKAQLQEALANSDTELENAKRRIQELESELESARANTGGGGLSVEQLARLQELEEAHLELESARAELAQQAQEREIEQAEQEQDQLALQRKAVEQRLDEAKNKKQSVRSQSMVRKKPMHGSVNMEILKKDSPADEIANEFATEVAMVLGGAEALQDAKAAVNENPTQSMARRIQMSEKLSKSIGTDHAPEPDSVWIDPTTKNELQVVGLDVICNGISVGTIVNEVADVGGPPLASSEEEHDVYSIYDSVKTPKTPANAPSAPGGMLEKQTPGIIATRGERTEVSDDEAEMAQKAKLRSKSAGSLSDNPKKLTQRIEWDAQAIARASEQGPSMANFLESIAAPRTSISGLEEDNSNNTAVRSSVTGGLKISVTGNSIIFENGHTLTKKNEYISIDDEVKQAEDELAAIDRSIAIAKEKKSKTVFGDPDETAAMKNQQQSVRTSLRGSVSGFPMEAEKPNMKDNVNVVKSAFSLMMSTERNVVKKLHQDNLAKTEEIMALQREMADLNREIDDLNERLLAGDSSKKDGLSGPCVETQTSITGTKECGAFYLLEYPALMTELQLEQELEDLNGCALGSWESILEKIKNSRRPPSGVGSGFVSCKLFRRMFMGCVHRISRQDDLRRMCEGLMLAELEKACEAIHLLQESTLPEHCAPIRDHIFGRGLNKPKLFAEFSSALVKEWIPKLQKCEEVIANYSKSSNGSAQIELGVHEPSRRTFTGVTAGTRDKKGMVGGKQPIARTMMSMNVAMFDGDGIADEVGEEFRSPHGGAHGMPNNPQAGAQRLLAMISGDTTNAGTYMSGNETKHPGRRRSVSPPEKAHPGDHYSHHPAAGAWEPSQMGFNINKAKMSPRTHSPISPRSRDKFLNLPQYNRDFNGMKVVDTDMSTDDGGPQFSRPASSNLSQSFRGASTNYHHRGPGSNAATRGPSRGMVTRSQSPMAPVPEGHPQGGGTIHNGIRGQPIHIPGVVPNPGLHIQAPKPGAHITLQSKVNTYNFDQQYAEIMELKSREERRQREISGGPFQGGIGGASAIRQAPQDILHPRAGGVDHLVEVAKTRDPAQVQELFINDATGRAVSSSDFGHKNIADGKKTHPSWAHPSSGLMPGGGSPRRPKTSGPQEDISNVVIHNRLNGASTNDIGKSTFRPLTPCRPLSPGRPGPSGSPGNSRFLSPAPSERSSDSGDRFHKKAVNQNIAKRKLEEYDSTLSDVLEISNVKVQKLPPLKNVQSPKGGKNKHQQQPISVSQQQMSIPESQQQMPNTSVGETSVDIVGQHAPHVEPFLESMQKRQGQNKVHAVPGVMCGPQGPTNFSRNKDRPQTSPHKNYSHPAGAGVQVPRARSAAGHQVGAAHNYHLHLITNERAHSQMVNSVKETANGYGKQRGVDFQVEKARQMHVSGRPNPQGMPSAEYEARPKPTRPCGGKKEDMNFNRRLGPAPLGKIGYIHRDVSSSSGQRPGTGGGSAT